MRVRGVVVVPDGKCEVQSRQIDEIRIRHRHFCGPGRRRLQYGNWAYRGSLVAPGHVWRLLVEGCEVQLRNLNRGSHIRIRGCDEGLHTLFYLPATLFRFTDSWDEPVGLGISSASPVLLAPSSASALPHRKAGPVP